MGALSYDDYKNRYQEKLTATSKLPKPKEKTINDYKRNLNLRSQRKESAVKSLRSDVEEKGIIAGNNILSAPNSLSVRINMYNDNKVGIKPLLKYTHSDIKKIDAKEKDNIYKYNSFISSDEGKKQKEKVLQARDDESYARYDYAQAKAKKDYENSNPIRKTINQTVGSLGRGIFSTIVKSDNLVRNKNGETFSLPNYAEAEQNVISSNSKGIRKIANDVFFQSGRIATSAALNAIIPGAGTTTYFSDMYTDQINSAMQEGYSSKQALSYATLGTATEIATGKVLGSAVGLFSKSGTTESLISNALKKVISNQKINSIISSMGSEGLEEFTQEYLEVVNRNLTLGEKEDLFTEENFKNAIYSGIVGALSSGMSSSLGTISQGKIVNTANQIVYDIERANNTDLSNVNKKLIENIMYEQILDGKSNINAQEIVNQFQTMKQNKINTMKESAYNYLANNNETNTMLDTISKIIYDRNYNIIFDNKITNEKGKSVNALINGDNIVINPDSSNKVEFLLMHEVTHSIETNELINLVMDYAKKNPEFKDALNSLKKAYGTNDVSSEVLADISGKLFGNQEFINKLSNSEPTLFKKISEKITSIANNLTGNSKESIFIKDLKNKWGNAYRIQENNLYSTNYSKGTLTTGESVVISDDVNGSHPDKIKVTQSLKKMLGIKYINESNNSEISIENKDIKKYLNDGYNNQKNMQLKKRIAGNYGEILEISKINPNLSKSNYKGTNRGRQGFDYYNVNLAYPVKDSSGNILNYKYYEARLVVRKDNDSNFAYDLDNFKEKKGAVLDKSNLSIVTDSSVDGSFSKDNITNSNENVKSSTEYSMQEDVNNTQENNKWQEFLDSNFKSSGTTTDMQNIRKKVQNNQTLNPLEISKLRPEDANTTPMLPKVNRNKVNDGKSKFFDNINEKTNMLTEGQKEHILSDEEVRYYDKVTNKEALEKAYNRLNNGGSFETLKWQRKFSFDENGKMKEIPTSVDVAEGWILMKQYADNGDYDSMVEIAKTMRNIGTQAGQTVQAFNIMERLTPEGMVKYAQSELTEAYNRMIKNQTQEWINKHRLDFDLTGEEVQFIMDNMKDVSTMEDGYDKRVKLAEIQKLMTDKLPPAKGAGLKSWMRISMLFNPKTQVRNVVGNAVIAPVNYFGDMLTAPIDSLISKKTGIRTTGNINIQAIIKGIKEGAYEATNDFKKGINTKDMEGNRFEIGEGRSFSNKNAIGKSLNRVDSLLSYMLDVGDRVFSQSSFENSLRNQMILNNTTEVTQEMIDIARTESLQRTWNDSNGYTKFVLDARKGLNKIINIKGYGLGDVLIPFAKTPANLTKAIVDYSPAGLVQAINDGIKLKRSLTNGQFTPQMQHKFVQELGKATAGTLLYVAGYALAKAGITSGESDDDKDVANFMKNTLGINNYSIKIGDKTFTYDWAQPLAAPLAITANLYNKSKADTTGIEKVLSSLDTAGNILLEQSFLDSLNTVLSNNDGIATGIEEAVLELPSRAVPTFMKQVADMIDGTQRTSFEKDKPLESAVNKVKVKLPGISKSLAPSVDTLGREIQKYGGENNIFNVFLNPANINSKNISESAKEIYDVYKATGDKNIMPRVSDYKYKDADGSEHIMTSKQRASYQKKSGQMIEENVAKLINNKAYSKMSNVEKADILNNIVNYSYNIGKHEEFGTVISNKFDKAYSYSKVGNITDYYMMKSQEFDSDKDKDGKTISGSKREKVIKYINSMDIDIMQKAMLIKFNNYSLSGYDEKIINYVNAQKLSMDEKKALLNKLGYTIKDGRVYWK